MTATPAVKALGRLERRIRQHCWASYEGYSLNHPVAGDVLVHLRTADGGRRSIRILASGAMRWAKGPVVFVPELFDAAAECCRAGCSAPGSAESVSFDRSAI